MSILVVCPSCKKSFQVSEKFAGKTGPCPKCKGTIRVPEASQEVKVHGGEDFSSGGRTISGQLALKPIARKQVKIKPVLIASIAGAVVGVLVLALLGRAMGIFGHYWAETLGLLVLSPLLVIGAYNVLYDDELEPYRGMPLYLRAGACAAAYIVLWGLFVYVKGVVQPTNEIYLWLIIAAPCLVLGGLTAQFSLDLETGNAFTHYAFYVVVTMLLGWIAGAWSWMPPPSSLG